MGEQIGQPDSGRQEPINLSRRAFLRGTAGGMGLLSVIPVIAGGDALISASQNEASGVERQASKEIPLPTFQERLLFRRVVGVAEIAIGAAFVLLARTLYRSAR